ncbi:MAG: hypothetical protein NVS3B3_07440 [Aquirhabdus sp.]
MKKFVFLYGGMDKPKEAPSPEHMQAWTTYFGKLGSALVDGGAPFMLEDKLLGNASNAKVTGYSIIQAENLAQAVALTEGHPMLAYGGGIQVMECMDMSKLMG